MKRRVEDVLARARRPGTGRSRPRRSRRESSRQIRSDAHADSIIDAMGFLPARRSSSPALLSNRSIAYGIAKAARREGAELAFTYQNERFKDRVGRPGEGVRRRASCCPATSPATRRSTALFAELRKRWDGLDGLVHAIAFAPREAIEGRLPRRAVARGVRAGARHLGLQLRRARQGGAADDAGAARGAGHADLPRRGARGAELQHDGPRQGEPGSRRALPRREPRARRASA